MENTNALVVYPELNDCCRTSLEVTVADAKHFSFEVSLGINKDAQVIEHDGSDNEPTLLPLFYGRCRECGNYWDIDDVTRPGVPPWIQILFEGIDDFRVEEGIC